MKTVLTALALLLYSGAAWAAPPPKLKTEPPAIQATEVNAKYTENVVEQSDVVNVANAGEVARVAAPESASIIMLMTNDTELAMEREGIGITGSACGRALRAHLPATSGHRRPTQGGVTPLPDPQRGSPIAKGVSGMKGRG